jgi:hypothetical protein
MWKYALITAALSVAAAALALPALARPAASSSLPVELRAKPDPLVEPGHDPYVDFSLVRTTTGRRYRISQQQGPRSTPGTCVSSLTTEWTRALKGGVAFDLEPVPSGNYKNYPGFDPCHGTYILKIEVHGPGASFSTIRRVAFSYPTFKVRYLALRPI